MRQAYRNRSGQLLGWRQTSGNRVSGHDRAGYLMGWYVPARDATFDRSGRLLGAGDMLAALIFLPT